MKKLFTLILAIAGYAGTLSAWTTVKFLNSIENVWDGTATTEMTRIDDGTNNYFYYILDSSNVTDAEGNYYFRIFVTDNSAYYGAYTNNAGIEDVVNYGGTTGTNSFKLVTNKSTKYIISVGYWDGVWHFTATKYSGTGTVFFNNTNNFTNPYAYVYCSGEARLTGGWPGTKMTSNGDGTYSLSDVNIGRLSKVIISDQGSNQIADQSFSGDIVMDGNGTVSSLSVNIGSLGYSTFSSIYPVDFSNVTDVTAYRADLSTIGENPTVVLRKVTGKVAANTGLVLKGTTTTIPTATSGESVSGNYLVPTVKEKTIEIPSSGGGDFCYFLSGTSSNDVGFYYLSPKPNETAYYTSGAGKAFLRHNRPLKDDSNSARAAWIIEGEETQGINTVESTQNADVVYDLQGRVAKTAKAGLYIKNGKKVIMK